jgi:ankyrin repeat protein
MQRIRNQHPQIAEVAIKVIMWVTCATRPLNSVEIQHAIAIGLDAERFDEDSLPDVEDLVSYCQGLVAVDKGSDIIKLFHFTTQEFLKTSWKVFFPNAHSQIGNCCITYLSLDAFDGGSCTSRRDFQCRLQTYPLYPYSATSWGLHAQEKELDHGILMQFLRSDEKASASFQAILTEPETRNEWQWHYPYHFRPWKTTGLHLAAYYGVQSAVKSLILNGQSVDPFDSYNRTPLSLAADGGHCEVADLLLANGAAVHTKDNQGRSPLSYAIIFGNSQMAELLLEKGADPNTKTTNRSTVTEYEAMPDTIFDANSNPYFIEHPENKAFLRKGWEKVSTRIPDDSSEYGGSSSSEESYDDYYDDERLILATECGDTPLDVAVELQNAHIVSLLLNYKADPDQSSAFGENGERLLSHAIKLGNERIVELLIAESKNPNVPDCNGRTPFFYAVGLSRESVVRLLLNCPSMKPNVSDKVGRTPFSYAMDRSRPKIVKLLIMKGIFQSAEDIETSRLFSWVAKYGDQETFISLPPEVSGSQDTSGRTILSYSAELGNLAVAQVCLESGIPVDAVDCAGRTPLSWAAGSGQTALVDLLLNARADPDQADLSGQTPSEWVDKYERSIPPPKNKVDRISGGFLGISAFLNALTALSAVVEINHRSEAAMIRMKLDCARWKRSSEQLEVVLSMREPASFLEDE